MHYRIAAAPAFPGLRRFPEGRKFKQWTGDDSKALMKVSFYCIYVNFPSFDCDLMDATCRYIYRPLSAMFRQRSSRPSCLLWTSVTSHDTPLTTRNHFDSWTSLSSTFTHIEKSSSRKVFEMTSLSHGSIHSFITLTVSNCSALQTVSVHLSRSLNISAPLRSPGGILTGTIPSAKSSFVTLV